MNIKKLPDKNILLALRNDSGMTFREIAGRYGVSHQRVQQVIGGDGKTFRDKFIAKKVKIDSTTTTDQALNFLGGKMKSAISRALHKIHHGISGNSQLSVGDLGERIVSEKLFSNGVQHTLQPLMQSVDIITESGISIDVKTAKSPCKTSKFQKGLMYKFAIRKKEKGDYCDLFAFYILPLDFVFFVPSNLFKNTDYTYISLPFSKRAKIDWEVYQDNYAIIG